MHTIHIIQYLAESLYTMLCQWTGLQMKNYICIDMTGMVLILDGNSEHVALCVGKQGFFYKEKQEICEYYPSKQNP